MIILLVSSILIYLIGVIILLLSIKNGRITILLIWPYLIYGTALPFAAYNYEMELFSYIDLFNYKNIVIAQLIMLSGVILIYLLDKIFLTKDFFTKKINNIRKEENPIVVKIVNSKIYNIYIYIQSLILLFLLLWGWISGDLIIGDYLSSISSNIWGTLGFFVENLLATISIYIYGLLIFTEKIKRNKKMEFLVLCVFIFRLLFGTRLFLAKLVVFILFILLLYKKNYFKVFGGLIVLICILSFFALFRLNAYYFDDINSLILSSIFSEGYYTDLTLLISCEALNNARFEYQPLAVITFFSGLIPNFILDRNELINEFYNKSIIMQSLGADSIAPLGAMSFLAELIYAFGWGYIVAIFVMAFFLILFIRKLNNSYNVCILFMLGQVAINLWRDSFNIAIKIFVVHILINFFVIYFLNKKIKI